MFLVHPGASVLHPRGPCLWLGSCRPAMDAKSQQYLQKDVHEDSRPQKDRERLGDTEVRRYGQRGGRANRVQKEKETERNRDGERQEGEMGKTSDRKREIRGPRQRAPKILEKNNTESRLLQTKITVRACSPATTSLQGQVAARTVTLHLQLRTNAPSIPPLSPKRALQSLLLRCFHLSVLLGASGKDGRTDNTTLAQHTFVYTLSCRRSRPAPFFGWCLALKVNEFRRFLLPLRFPFAVWRKFKLLVNARNSYRLTA